MHLCRYCGEEISNARHNLGYASCLACGEIEAIKLSQQKAKRIAPHFDKGPYQYLTDADILNLRFNTKHKL